MRTVVWLTGTALAVMVVSMTATAGYLQRQSATIYGQVAATCLHNAKQATMQTGLPGSTCRPNPFLNAEPQPPCPEEVRALIVPSALATVETNDDEAKPNYRSPTFDLPLPLMWGDRDVGAAVRFLNGQSREEELSPPASPFLSVDVWPQQREEVRRLIFSSYLARLPEVPVLVARHLAKTTASMDAGNQVGDIDALRDFGDYQANLFYSMPIGPLNIRDYDNDAFLGWYNAPVRNNSVADLTTDVVLQVENTKACDDEFSPAAFNECPSKPTADDCCDCCCFMAKCVIDWVNACMTSETHKRAVACDNSVAQASFNAFHRDGKPEPSKCEKCCSDGCKCCCSKNDKCCSAENKGCCEKETSTKGGMKLPSPHYLCDNPDYIPKGPSIPAPLKLAAQQPASRDIGPAKCGECEKCEQCGHGCSVERVPGTAIERFVIVVKEDPKNGPYGVVFENDELCKSCMVVRTYPVNGVLKRQANDMNSVSQLCGLVCKMVEPESWRDVGGQGCVDYFAPGRVLVIRQTPQVHEQIQQFFRQLSDAVVAQSACEDCEVKRCEATEPCLGPKPAGLEFEFRIQLPVKDLIVSPKEESSKPQPMSIEDVRDFGTIEDSYRPAEERKQTPAPDIFAPVPEPTTPEGLPNLDHPPQDGYIPGHEQVCPHTGGSLMCTRQYYQTPRTYNPPAGSLTQDLNVPIDAKEFETRLAGTTDAWATNDLAALVTQWLFPWWPGQEGSIRPVSDTGADEDKNDDPSK